MNHITITENDVISVYMPRIKRFCRGKWPNLEPEDRESEATLYFVCALRSFPIGCGHFWEDYCNALIPYMNHLNRIAPPRYFKKEHSLDHPISMDHAKSAMTLLDILKGPDLDESSLSVESFIETLSSEDQEIIRDLMKKVPRTLVARKHHLSIYALKKRLDEIGKLYIER